MTDDPSIIGLGLLPRRTERRRNSLRCNLAGRQVDLGRLIYNAFWSRGPGQNSLALSVSTLPFALVLATFRTPQVSALSGTQLLNSGFEAAGGAAIALPAIAVRTDEEKTAAIDGFAIPLTERFVGGC